MFKTLYAASCVGLGEHERAIGLYRELLAGAPQDAEVYLSIGARAEDARPDAGGDRVLPAGGRFAAPISAMPTGASPT